MRATEIPIASPCGADWRTMKPSDTRRFCESCKKHVHDLSAMTSGEARALLGSPPTEGLCVRYLYDQHGEIVFRNAPMPAGMLVRARRFATAAATVALPMAMAACSSSMGEGPVPMMGVVACPMPTAQPDSGAADAAAPPLEQMRGTPAALPPPKN